MGQVYEAFDQQLDRSVALKVIRPEVALHKGVIERFRSEVRLAHRVSHANVCRIFDLFEHRSRASAPPLGFLTMELIRGQTLARQLKRDGAIPPDRARPLLQQMAAALEAAHRAGIVHGDLKPSNIMVSGREGSRRLVITDFGLARARGTGAPATELSPVPEEGAPRMGTPAYMAPEQETTGEATERSDLYAFGLIAFEMLTGTRFLRPPAKEELAIRAKTWPQGLRQLVLGCLETDPARRPRSARDLVESLAGSGRLRALLCGRRTSNGETVDLSGAETEPYMLGETFLVPLDHPIDAVDFALETLYGYDGEGPAPSFAIHLGEIESGADRDWPVARPARDQIETMLELSAPGRILLSRSAFETARQQGRTGPDGSARQRSGLQWLVHGSYRVGELPEAIEVFAVADGDRASAEPPPEGPTIRRLVHPATILGWRPGVGQVLPHRPHWIIERKLGEGGFGEAWLARHAKTGDPRVLKFCYDAERLGALQREVTLFRLLRTELGEREDINRVLDWNLDTEPFYIETEYSTGGDLLTWAERQGGLASIPREILLELAAQIADALAAAHSIGVLHKDIKPANVFIEERSGRPRVRLADFGIGHVLDRGRLEAAGITVLGLTGPSTPTSAAGSRLYIPPELTEGRTPTVQADIYALGVMLYQMVVGDFSRALADGWRRQVEDPLLTEDIALAVDGRVENRPSAADMAARLRNLEDRRCELEDQQRLRTRLESSLEQLERDRRRRRVLTTTLIVTAVVFLVLVGLLRRISAESERARDAARLAVAIGQLDEDPTTAAVVLRDVESPDRRARALLRQTLSHPLAHLELRLPRTAGAVAISRDGSRVAAADRVGEIFLWPTGVTDGRPGAPILLRGHEKPIDAMHFDPAGRMLITSSRDMSIRIWDLEGPRRNWGHSRIFRQHGGKVWRLDLDPAGQWVVAPSEDHNAYIFRIDGEGVTTVLRGHRHWVIDARFSHDGQRVVTASRDGTVRVWDRSSGRALAVFEGHESWVFHATFSPDGRHVVSASRDGTARIWDTAGLEPPKLLEGHERSVYWAHYRPDGQQILTSSQDGTVRTWTADGQESSVRLRKQARVGASYSPDGTWIAVPFDRAVQIMPSDGSDQGMSFLDYRRVAAMAFSEDGSWLVTSAKNAVRLWPLDSQRWGWILKDLSTGIATLSVSPDGRRIALGATDSTIRLLDPDGSASQTLTGHRNSVEATAFHPDGHQLASGSSDDTARLWILSEPTRSIDLGFHGGSVVSLAYSPDGSMLATGSFDGSIRLWNTGQPQADADADAEADAASRLLAEISLSDFVVGSLTFSRDGRHLLAGSGYGTLGVFELSQTPSRVSLELVSTLEGLNLRCLRFDTTGQLLSAVSSPHGIVIFEWADPSRWPLSRRREWSLDNAIIACPEFDADGDRLVFSTAEGMVRVLPIRGALEPLELLGHTSRVTSTSFLPNGQVISGSIDGTVRIWRANRQDPLVAVGERVQICLPPDARRIHFFETGDESEHAYRRCLEQLGQPEPSTTAPSVRRRDSWYASDGDGE